MRALSGASLAVVAMLGLSSMVSCAKVNSVRAMLTFKQADQAYQAQDYKRAAELYEETIQSNPDQVQVYFFLGNSYDNLYKPGVSKPDNEALLAKAIQNYELAATRLSADKPDEVKLKKLSLQYLAAAFGSDMQNDPVKAEPVIQRMIQLDPTDSSNYFALAKLYEDAGAYDE